MGYNIETDPDLNSFETSDLKDLTQSGLGTSGREFVTLEEFLVSMLIFVLFFGLVVFFIFSVTKFFSKT